MDTAFTVLEERDECNFSNLQSAVQCNLQVITDLCLRQENLRVPYHSDCDGFVYFSHANNVLSMRSKRKTYEILSRVIIDSTKDIITISEFISSIGGTPGQLILESQWLLEEEKRENLFLCVSTLLTAGVTPIFSFRENSLFQKTTLPESKSSMTHGRRARRWSEDRSIAHAQNA